MYHCNKGKGKRSCLLQVFACKEMWAVSEDCYEYCLRLCGKHTEVNTSVGVRSGRKRKENNVK